MRLLSIFLAWRVKPCNHKPEEPFWRKFYSIKWFNQEPITRSLQLPHIPVTAFSQSDLFLV